MWAVNVNLKSAFLCKSKGKLKEYVGKSMKHRDERIATIKITQPVLIQKIKHEFDLPKSRSPKTPVLAEQVLVRGNGSDALEGHKTRKYWLHVPHAVVET